MQIAITFSGNAPMALPAGQKCQLRHTINRRSSLDQPKEY